MKRRLLLTTALVGCLAVVMAAPAWATQSGTVTLHGYGGVAEQVYTTENSYVFVGALGSAGGSTSQLHIQRIADSGNPTGSRTDIYFVLPFNPPVPGTYTAPGAWSYVEPGLVFQSWSQSVFCDGGTFTINSIDTSNPAGLEFDVSWTQSNPVCSLTPMSGRAIFATAPTDVAPPTLTVPAPITTNAANPTGATVTYEATATDDIDPNPVVSCTPPSGSLFPIGTTTVICTAADPSGNSASTSFTVHVKGAAEQLADLRAAVNGVGPGKSLAVAVGIAEWLVAHGQRRAACTTLSVFNLEVRALSRRKLPPAQATALIADSNRIKTVLGC